MGNWSLVTSPTTSGGRMADPSDSDKCVSLWSLGCSSPLLLWTSLSAAQLGEGVDITSIKCDCCDCRSAKYVGTHTTSTGVLLSCSEVV